jgi:CheY-like chemotaxis protein
MADGDRASSAPYLQVLSQGGFRIVQALDGLDAFRQACRLRPAVIVTELLLPEVDGWTLIQRLKSDDRTSDIPVVVLTGCVVPSYPSRARREGCAAFLSKPCGADQLARQLQWLGLYGGVVPDPSRGSVPRGRVIH